jgi:hypothetical protein
VEQSEARCGQGSHESPPRYEQVLFGAYFNRVEEFLSFMKRYRCIASGPAVLGALLPEGTPGSPLLGLYVHKAVLGNEGCYVWHDMLRSEGYDFVDRALVGGRGAFSFVYKRAGTGVRLALYATSCEPLQHVVSLAWSTHLMNIATWEGIYCPFPQVTLRDRRMFVLREPDANELQVYDHYLSCGFMRIPSEEVARASPFGKDRWIGDVDSERRGFTFGNEIVQALGALEFLRTVTFNVSIYGVRGRTCV